MQPIERLYCALCVHVILCLASLSSCCCMIFKRESRLSLICPNNTMHIKCIANRGPPPIDSEMIWAVSKTCVYIHLVAVLSLQVSELNISNFRQGKLRETNIFANPISLKQAHPTLKEVKLFVTFKLKTSYCLHSDYLCWNGISKKADFTVSQKKVSFVG